MKTLEEMEKELKELENIDSTSSKEGTFLSNSIDNYPGNRPTPKPPEVIPDIPKPDNLIPPPIPIPDEEDEPDEEEKLRFVETLFPDKKDDIIKIVKGTPTNVLEPNKKESLYEMRKRLTQEVLEELKARRDAEIELEKSYLIECEGCHEKTLKKRYDTCECGHKRKTPEELKKEKQKADDIIEARKARELRNKQLAEAKRKRDERWAEAPLTTFLEEWSQDEKNCEKFCNFVFR